VDLRLLTVTLHVYGRRRRIVCVYMGECTGELYGNEDTVHVICSLLHSPSGVISACQTLSFTQQPMSNDF
jgi:hypothetical protein